MPGSFRVCMTGPAVLFAPPGSNNPGVARSRVAESMFVESTYV